MKKQAGVKKTRPVRRSGGAPLGRTVKVLPLNPKVQEDKFRHDGNSYWDK